MRIRIEFVDNGKALIFLDVVQATVHSDSRTVVIERENKEFRPIVNLDYVKYIEEV